MINRILNTVLTASANMISPHPRPLGSAPGVQGARANAASPIFIFGGEEREFDLPSAHPRPRSGNQRIKSVAKLRTLLFPGRRTLLFASCLNKLDTRLRGHERGVLILFNIYRLLT